MFESAKLKIERADQHISDFKAAFKAFTDHHRHTIHVLGMKKGPMYFEIVFDAPLPSALSLILSDAIHNLSTALDHAMWELIGHDQGLRDRYTKLPTGHNRVDFEASCKGIKTPVQSTIDFLVQLAIYPKGGGEPLYWLRQLDNAEKHTILSPVIQAASVERIEFIDLADNSRWESKNVILHPGPDGRSYIKLEPGLGIDCNEKHKTTGDVFFGDVQGVPHEPIIPTLVHFRDAVSDTLREFRRLVVARYPGLPAKMRADLIG
jgi:hypothetical protein